MSSLNCNEFDRLLTDVVENRRDDVIALRAHAEECATCAEKLAEHYLLARAVVAWKNAVPTVDLAEGVLSAVAVERIVVLNSDTETRDRKPTTTPRVTMSIIDSPVSKYTKWEMTAALLTAAVAMLLVPLLSLNFESDHKQDRDSVAMVDSSNPAANPVAGSVAAAPDEQVDMDRLVTGLQSRVTGLGRNVTEAVSSLRVDLPGMNIDVMPGIQAQPQIAPQLPAAPDSWGEDFKPVGRDVRKAFGFLREAIPVSTTAERS